MVLGCSSPIYLGTGRTRNYSHSMGNMMTHTIVFVGLPGYPIRFIQSPRHQTCIAGRFPRNILVFQKKKKYIYIYMSCGHLWDLLVSNTTMSTCQCSMFFAKIECSPEVPNMIQQRLTKTLLLPNSNAKREKTPELMRTVFFPQRIENCRQSYDKLYSPNSPIIFQHLPNNIWKVWLLKIHDLSNTESRFFMICPVFAYHSK